MASLNHVCIWSEKGWKPIKAYEASRLHPTKGGVSYKSGLFRCDLCGQYVSLTREGRYVSYFKHSSDEKSRDCPDKVQASATINTFQAGVHTLPLRLSGITSTSFELQMGLLPIPEELLPEVYRSTIRISAKDAMKRSLVYNGSRVQQDCTTYLSLGDIIAETYVVDLTCESKSVSAIWPERVDGISRLGTLFDAKTGKKLPPDADVQVDCAYYMLTKRSLFSWNGIYQKCICNHIIGLDMWKVYEIRATEFSEDAARFFMEYHCRLTEHPVLLFPLWPVYIEKPYVVLHEQAQITMFLQGYCVSPKVFPSASIRVFTSPDREQKAFQLECSDRQQLLSTGRTKVLRYMYLWRETLSSSAEVPRIYAADVKGNMIENGVQNELPKGQVLVVFSQFDGMARLLEKGRLIRRYLLKAGERMELSVQFGYEIIASQGLDSLLYIRFERQNRADNLNEKEMLQRLMRCRGAQVAVSHEWGSIFGKLRKLPMIQHWLYQKIREGAMPKSAFLLLMKYINTIQ